MAALGDHRGDGRGALAFAIGSSSAIHAGRPCIAGDRVPAGAAVGERTGRSRWGRAPTRSARSTRSGPPPPATTPRRLRHGTGPSVMTYLAAHAASACATAGACGLLIQAVVAAGLNPSSFGGVNLLTTLKGMYTAPASTATARHSPSRSPSRAWSPPARPVPAAAVHHLVAAQDSDGGWDYLLIKDDPNGSTNFDTSDTNSTAMVLMALNAAGTHSRNASALAWLHTQQDGDGGFPYQAGAGTDPDSTALVLQALIATGQNPEASAWAPGGTQPARRADRHPGRRRRLHLPRQLRTRSLHHRPGPAGAGDGSPIPSASPSRKGFTPAAEAQGGDRCAALSADAAVGERTGRSRWGRAPTRSARSTRSGPPPPATTPRRLRHGTGPSVMTYLRTQAASACATAGACGLLIQAVVAAHLNPSSFGGVNLITTLKGMYKRRRLRRRRGIHRVARHPGPGRRRPDRARRRRPPPRRRPGQRRRLGLPAHQGRSQRLHQLRHQRHQLHGDGAHGAQRRRDAQPQCLRARLAAHPAGR